MTKTISRLVILSLLAVFFPLQSQQNSSASFMVFSDPHYYDPSLGTDGKAFQEYLDNDRKLLKESWQLLEEAVKMIKDSDVDFVIIPGDLTKDGTRVSHENFSKIISDLNAAGKPAYVVPGNHDLLNGESNSYRDDEKVLVENIGPDDFAELYSQFGYNQALYRDPNSLSYVIEPAPGIWFFALDACLYRENEPGHHPVTDGEFLQETLDWVDKIARIGHEQNKLLLGFMHHGVLEHYQKQDKFYGEYVVNNYKKVSKLFASLGIKVMFTGHYHAQDITMKQWNDGKYIIDVETGSLVTYPCPVRLVTISGDEMRIASTFIESIPMHPEGFTEYSRAYVHDGISGIAEGVMIDMRLNREDAQQLSGQIGDAFIAHYSGDEPTVDEYLDLQGVGLLGRIMILTKKRLIKELYSDLPPADNNLLIDLSDGTIKPF